MKVKDILKYLVSESSLTITSIIDADHPFTGFAYDLPETYMDLEVHSFRANVNRFKWNKEVIV